MPAHSSESVSGRIHARFSQPDYRNQFHGSAWRGIFNQGTGDKQTKGDHAMTSGENRSSILAAIIVGVCLFLGFSVGGYFIGKGGTRV
jgi:hypothetical protein